MILKMALDIWYLISKSIFETLILYHIISSANMNSKFGSQII